MQFSGGNEQTQNGHVLISLTEEDRLHILHPGQIIAYKGNPSGREDRFMDLAGMYRKRRWIRSKISGPSELLLGLPQDAGCTSCRSKPRAACSMIFATSCFSPMA
ncbi:hypothetical protein ACFOHW_26215 [Paenibacillus abyssi]|uniref:hypothetical protein n=1 Tax=Paenibacillus abyssi TaxID=1340531 RepID=UPI0036104026